MSFRAFTSFYTTLKQFSKNPVQSLKNTPSEVLAILEQKDVMMYVITPNLMKKLFCIHNNKLDNQKITVLENYFKKFAYQKKNQKHNNDYYEEKFSMYDNWKPDDNFLDQALIWGIKLQEKPTCEELSAFKSYWKAEGRFFYHVQWQQKLARSLITSRTMNSRLFYKRDINELPMPDKKVPIGFRDE
ncbi:primosomal protein DnaI [Buchnera aphidicola (Thelaxes californica)]|uniref:Primosomal protein DnaI n=1 Tax=Buchnera aphidicola (Thelaxes californica) TaxID=1315998 RepID=A0A4D6YAZ8_9GAMM|nr:DnaT-like ssDNA-binding domain-containing protein [Buchnera aphidicola]QCI26579.1 primosomal protein DnaI [Buchnera aphidicola (Thelaxes californica)]